MTIALSTAVSTKSSLTFLLTVRCSRAGSGLKTVNASLHGGSPEGRNHLVSTNTARIAACAASNPNANSCDRKTSSGTNRQFTVHFQKKALPNSNARPQYAAAFSFQKGYPSNTCSCSIIPTFLKKAPLPSPRVWARRRRMAGAARRRGSFVASPRE